MRDENLSAKLFRLSTSVRASNVGLRLKQLARAVEAHFDSNQPRVPAGNPGGGQWTDTGAGRSTGTAAVFSGGMRRISTDLQDRCWSQYMRDVFQCRMVGLASCYQQAALRHANCLAELPIPPLNY